MERALPLLTAAVLAAALAGCSAGAENATAPPPTAAPVPAAEPSAPAQPGKLSDRPPATGSVQQRPTGEARARIVVGAGAVFGQAGHGAHVCKLISTPTVSLYSAGGSMSGSGVALAVDANESGTTVLELPAGEINLTAYCTDPGGVGPAFTGTSAAFVVTEGGSTDVEIIATPHP
ncbi:hypothetical protein ACMX2H_17775 [Arthrobacter sulfonylureivorans]|uniref:hypothetical protein n=1 Tax=Arthrobacter sulfonylureivorans TaxID=2486855 RepID=UPI0039E31BB5